MKKIKLTRNKYALVDDTDFDSLNEHKWWFTTRGYAVREENGKVIFMHRVINATPKGLDTDHINRNKLDNRKSNLRSITRSKNCMNVNPPKNNTSGYLGVQKHAEGWMARIKVNYKHIYLGYFKHIDDAIQARKKAEIIYHAK